MNTERDNFYDWAKEKPDTRFASLSPSTPIQRARPSGSPWVRLAVFAAVVIGLSAAYHFFLS
ncbi:hypothetical protein [Variovorax sp. UMC13]|uniref:hypothetical protein n=1 Tax=Variovorax sp. UMC13 TaxID=1862326 RepID=UPI001601CC6C|nr:hypothetical protein [Variovorax sp. UMC13]MBB1600955.1 hypothetical protein [Variovorax sp. UMC13]